MSVTLQQDVPVPPCGKCKLIAGRIIAVDKAGRCTSCGRHVGYGTVPEAYVVSDDRRTTMTEQEREDAREVRFLDDRRYISIPYDAKTHQALENSIGSKLVGVTYIAPRNVLRKASGGVVRDTYGYWGMFFLGFAFGAVMVLLSVGR